MSYKLFLDDERKTANVFPDLAEEDFIIAKSFEEFKDIILKKGLSKFISFDDNLGSDLMGIPKPSCVVAAKWLVSQDQFDLSDLTFHIHGDDVASKEMISKILNDCVRHSNVMHKYINELSVVINHRYKMMRSAHVDFEESAIETVSCTIFTIKATDILTKINKNKKSANAYKLAGKNKMIEIINKQELTLIQNYIDYNTPLKLDKVTSRDKTLVYVLSDRLIL